MYWQANKYCSSDKVLFTKPQRSAYHLAKEKRGQKNYLYPTLNTQLLTKEFLDTTHENLHTHC